MEKIIYTLLIGALGGYAGIKLKIPAGAMIGSMISVAVYNVLSQKGYFPSNFKLIAQIVIGSVIGLNFTLESFIELKKLIIPAIILVVGLTFFSVTLGLILFKITGSNLFKSVAIDLPTALWIFSFKFQINSTNSYRFCYRSKLYFRIIYRIKKINNSSYNFSSWFNFFQCDFRTYII